MNLVDIGTRQYLRYLDGLPSFIIASDRQTHCPVCDRRMANSIEMASHIQQEARLAYTFQRSDMWSGSGYVIWFPFFHHQQAKATTLAAQYRQFRTLWPEFAV